MQTPMVKNGMDAIFYRDLGQHCYSASPNSIGNTQHATIIPTRQ
jgi:hypothetical protein